MSNEFERQLKQAMKGLGGSIPTTDYSMGETFGQMNLQFPQAPSFTMPKPRELGINRDFSPVKFNVYSFAGTNDAGKIAGDFTQDLSDKKQREAEKIADRQALADAITGANTNPAPTPSSPLPTGGGSTQPSGGKQPKTSTAKTPKTTAPKTPKTTAPKTPKPSSGGSTPKAPKAPTPQAPQAPTPQAPQAPTPTIPGGGRRSGSRREDAVGDRVRGVKQTTKSTIKPLTKPLTKATTGSSRGATTPDARNPGRRAPKKGRYT